MLNKALKKEVAQLRKDFDFLNGLVQGNDKTISFIQSEFRRVISGLRNEFDRKLIDLERKWLDAGKKS